MRANDQLLRSAGVVTDLESALFHADRGEAAMALAIAEAAYAARRTVFTADALAWARLGAGQIDSAVALVDEALAGGITNPSLRVHAAAVFSAAGDLERATAELTVAFRSTPWLTPSIRPTAAELAGELGIPLPEGWSS